ncbi:efflux RND transporter periplasmic adaptor subunit [Pseudoroseomonas cervicalis]|uniref:efflux RND transporter periplasmic adaptor subunit n=1 Tax=Teichococcus cervicalis TaxID=204525 RepID=UPI0022F19B85|nr:efflux RND transporter periplasmic adaptor subunit [Pseudoroseomonas cervicalis]WBV44745.1 efflux RND transporter periplasmic adaptor subunit [Pseudoroseomonas cervicalis]
MTSPTLLTMALATILALPLVPTPAAARDAAPATRPEAAPGVGALGRVEPASRIRRIGAPGGMNVTRLGRLLVEEGQRVAEGALLAELADAPQKEAQRQRAAAALAEAEARLALVQAAARPEEITAQQARLAGLRAEAENARREASRARSLVPSGAGGQAEAERRRFAALRAEAAQAEAEAELARLQSPRPEDVAVARAQRDAASAELRAAEAELELARMRAPIAGTILTLYVRPGDPVGNDGLLDMADLERMDVVADVYETDLPRLRLGQRAEVLVPGHPERLGATLREIGWQVRRTTQAGTDPVAAVDARTVPVRLTLDAEGVALLARRSNMQVQVAIRP